MAQDDLRSANEPADMQQSRTQEGQTSHQQSESPQSRQGDPPADNSDPSRFERYQEMINWQESIITGVVLWIVGFVLSIIPLWWFEFGDEFQDGTHELAVAVFLEGMGVTAADEILFTPVAYQSVLDTDAFGAGVFFHMILPAILLLIAGHVLAGRHIKQGRTNRPLETILATMTLALWVTILSLFAALVIASDAEWDVGELLLVTLMYTLVFTAIGGTIRSRSGITSKGGLLGGLGAFIVGFGLWYLVEDPLDPNSFSDLSGTFAHFSLFESFVFEHGLDGGELFPEWVMILVPLLVGAALGYAYKRQDWVVGLGEGARLGAGYFIPVFIVSLGFTAAWVRDLERQTGGWSPQEIAEVSSFIGILPRQLLLAGIVYPVVFAAIGGAIGAVAYKMQQDSQREPGYADQQQYQQESGQHQQEPAQQHQQGPDQQHQHESESIDSPSEPETSTGAVGAAGAGAVAGEDSDSTEELSASDIVDQTPDEPVAVDESVDDASTDDKPTDEETTDSEPVDENSTDSETDTQSDSETDTQR